MATLRFWNEAQRPVESAQRRRIRQWPSLLLQLLSIALLLLAVSQLRWGSRETGARDHVLLVSLAWGGALVVSAGATESLLDQSKSMALAYTRALPAVDRVMVVYADGLATPVTAFESDHRKVEDAIRRATAGASALNLAQALEFARGTLTRHARAAGEIVLAGGGRALTSESALPQDWPANLRLLTPKAVRKISASANSASALRPTTLACGASSFGPQLRPAPARRRPHAHLWPPRRRPHAATQPRPGGGSSL